MQPLDVKFIYLLLYLGKQTTSPPQTHSKGKYMKYENIVKNVTITISASGYMVFAENGEVIQDELLCDMMQEFTHYTAAEKLKLILDDIAEHTKWIGNKMCWELF